MAWIATLPPGFRHLSGRVFGSGTLVLLSDHGSAGKAGSWYEEKGDEKEGKAP